MPKSKTSHDVDQIGQGSPHAVHPGVWVLLTRNSASAMVPQGRFNNFMREDRNKERCKVVHDAHALHALNSVDPCDWESLKHEWLLIVVLSGRGEGTLEHRERPWEPWIVSAKPRVLCGFPKMLPYRSALVSKELFTSS